MTVINPCDYNQTKAATIAIKTYWTSLFAFWATIVADIYS